MTQTTRTWDVTTSSINDIGLPKHFFTSNPSNVDSRTTNVFSVGKFILRKLIHWGVLPEDPCCTGGVFDNSVTTAITALGTTQATAYILTTQYNQIAVGASTTGVILPPAKKFKFIQITNNVANAINIYPPVGGTINGGSVNAGVTIAAGKTTQFFGTSGINYTSIGL